MPVVVRLAAGLARWVCGEACRQLVLVVLFLAFTVTLPGVGRSLVQSYVDLANSRKVSATENFLLQGLHMCCDSPSLSATGKPMIVLSLPESLVLLASSENSATEAVRTVELAQNLHTIRDMAAKEPRQTRAFTQL